jgi:hypothetical protein
MKSIEVCIKDTQTTTEKGSILEQLTANILRSQQYDVTTTIRKTGIEIDVLAKHKINGTKLIAECKAWENPLPADAITKLLGNIELKQVNSGWLISTGPLSKDAKGIQDDWENQMEGRREKLSFYTCDRIIHVLIDLKIVVDPLVLLEKIDKNLSPGDNVILMLTDVAKYWLIPGFENNQNFVTAVLVFNAENGKQVSSVEQLERIKLYKNSLGQYPWIAGQKSDERITEQLSNEYRNVVPVISGDNWQDYRPARPEDFVGRKNLIDEIISFLINANTGISYTRIFSIQAPSGMGKSSVVLKLASIMKSRKYSKRYFFYAVDVRTAMSYRYVEMVVKSCFDQADSEGFTDIKQRKLNITSISQFFESDSIKGTLEYLKENGKSIIIVFDQFEELFSKKDLFSLFSNVRKFCNVIDSLQGPIILGFAWKTDITLPADHPAYYLWSTLADRRREFELSQFRSSEIKSAINLFGKQLGERINPILANYLTKQCQGYPWLLKKLCIHVFKLINEGNSQDSVIGKRLNIVDLFDRDISSLNNEQNACLKDIASNSPADYFNIVDTYSSQILQPLIDARIVIRRASKLTLYWDIFRDYVLTKAVPVLMLDYIPQQQFSTISRTIICLLQNGSMSVMDLSQSLSMNTTTIDNVMIDGVMFGILKKESGIISLTSSNEDNIVKSLQEFFKQHIIYIKMASNDADNLNYQIFLNTFNQAYNGDNINKKTKETYCKKLFNWFIELGLFTLDDDRIILAPNIQAKNIRLEQKTRKRRIRDGIIQQGTFWGQSSPNKIIDLYHTIRLGNTSYLELRKLGYRNSIELLRASNGVIKKGDNIIINKELSDIFSFINSTETICLTRQYLLKKPHASAIEVGDFLSKTYNRKWKKTSKVRYGSSLIRWVKYFEVINETNRAYGKELFD